MTTTNSSINNNYVPTNNAVEMDMQPLLKTYPNLYI
jgi:hypothetical protein